MNPFSVVRRVFDDMDRAFGWPANGGQESRMRLDGGWQPCVEMLTRNSDLVVRAELPGLTKDDVNVELTDQGLLIRGERKQEQQENREGFYRSERSYGMFSRLIPLPEGAKAEEAKAKFDNGVLEVTIPMTEQPNKSRKIPIEGTSQNQAQPSSPPETKGM
jgi:HSP20 family protein